MTYLRLGLLLLITLYSGLSIAQTRTDSISRYNNAVYAELGGPGGLYSIGYERTWYQTASFAVMTVAGFSYYLERNTVTYIEPGMLIRRKNVAFEFGVALGRFTQGDFNSRSVTSIMLVPRAGVRFFTRDQRVHFRIGITPIIELWSNERNPAPNPSSQFWMNVFTVGYRF